MYWYSPYQYLKSMMESVWYLNGHPNRTEPFVRLLFPQSYGVRHRFLNKIHFWIVLRTPLKNIGARVNEVLYQLSYSPYACDTYFIM